MVKILSVLQETRVRFLGWKDPLEKGMATHSSVLAWRIPWQEEPGGLQSMGLSDLVSGVQHSDSVSFFRFSSTIGYHKILGIVPSVCVCALSCPVVSGSLRHP